MQNKINKTMKKYRLKDEKFRKPAQVIAGFVVGGKNQLEYYVSIEGSAMRSKLEDFGVFELWFEEEPEFKSGDYIYVVDTGNIYEIEDCEIKGDELHWNMVGGCRGPHHYSYCTQLSNIRLATAEEIEKYNQRLPEINGYEGKLQYHYIIYGCKSIHIQDFRRLYEACLCMDLVVDSIKIEGHQVPMETLKEIYEKTY